MKEYKIFIDGNMWCAVNELFTNIQESPCGFGLTPGFALKELIEQEEDIDYTRENNENYN